MGDQTEKYLPFHAINEFMRDDYRLVVLHDVFGHFDTIPSDKRKTISQLVAKFVKIPGFRNSNLAPAAMKAKNSPSVFQQSPQFVAAVVESWAGLHNDLKEVVWNVINEHGWEPLPLDADRSQLPGFQIHWPKADTFEVFHKQVKETAPNLVESEDDISLMVVWLGNRLPYDLFVEDSEGE